ncbi:type II toxin-antitoxin system RelE/ParE family toxin [Algoriphagus vanfongensis]|uniref:type II toxin-antitoxin system RelE/ParE family toxin n=1 Tax=Algoriphagus vanfongensis TaxID=426371 RepID=UPI00047A60CF|nr:type II toxin-antitoxin system RelE/ParE family toxin [Algoriphagus vanfongensis]
MASYRLSEEAKDDLIRIHCFGTENFGINQADKYFEGFFSCFDRIAENPFLYESVDYIKESYRRCVCQADSIYFKINHDTVEIMANVGRQDLSQLT